MRKFETMNLANIVFIGLYTISTISHSFNLNAWAPAVSYDKVYTASSIGYFAIIDPLPPFHHVVKENLHALSY